MSTASAIEFKNIYKKFGSFYALSGTSFNIERGTIHGFVGPNGAGKTTTMKILNGNIYPTSGEAYIYGNKAGTVEAKKNIGYAPEFPAFYSDMSALDYLIYMALLGRVSYKEACYKAEDLIDMLNLKAFRDKRIFKFSTGMKKKMGLAQAMIHDPAILLLDEPTANMDPTARMEIVEYLKYFVAEKKLTLLISSHVLSELEQIVTNVTLIDKGVILKQGSVEEIGNSIKLNNFIVSFSDNMKLLAALADSDLVKNAVWETDNGEKLGWIGKAAELDSENSEEEKTLPENRVFIEEFAKSVDVQAGEIKISTDNLPELKKLLVKVAYEQDMLINNMTEEQMSLENIYKTIIVKGGKPS